MEFLLIAVVVGGVGIAIVLWRHREPRGVHHGVHDFRRGIQALAPHRHHDDDEHDRPPPRHRPPRREER
jgi:hypothetical protein